MESAGVPARVIRWTAIGLGALLALAVVCGLLLRLLFDPNDYRRRIELAFNERTGRTLELEGDLRLQLLPRLAVSTGPLSISDRAGAGDFLTAQDARSGSRCGRCCAGASSSAGSPWSSRWWRCASMRTVTTTGRIF